MNYHQGIHRLRSRSPSDLRSGNVMPAASIAETIGVALREWLAPWTAPRPLARHILRRPVIGLQNLQDKLGCMVHPGAAARPIADSVRMNLTKLCKLALRYDQ